MTFAPKIEFEYFPHFRFKRDSFRKLARAGILRKKKRWVFQGNKIIWVQRYFWVRVPEIIVAEYEFIDNKESTNCVYHISLDILEKIIRTELDEAEGWGYRITERSASVTYQDLIVRMEDRNNIVVPFLSKKVQKLWRSQRAEERTSGEV